MYNPRSLATIKFAIFIICAMDFANSGREVQIPSRPIINLSRIERENPKWFFSKRFQSYDDNKVTRKFLNASDLIAKANLNLRSIDDLSESAFGRRSFLGKNHRLFHRNRFRQATNKIKSFFEIIDHLPPTNLPMSTKLNRRVTAITTKELLSSSTFSFHRPGKVVLFTRNNVTFPKWMLNANVVQVRQRSTVIMPGSNLCVGTYPCPTFCEMWHECTAPRRQRHFPRTLTRRTCTIPRGLSPRSLNNTYSLDRTRIWPLSMPLKCSSPGSTEAFWRTVVECASASPRMLHEAKDKYCLFSCTFPKTTGCCTDPTSTCSEPTSTEQETAWCTDPTTTPFLPRLYLIRRIEKYKQDNSKQNNLIPHIITSYIPKANIPKLDLITPYIPKSGILHRDIPQPDYSIATIPRPAARGAFKDQKNSRPIFIEKRCSCACTPPTSTCTPPTSTDAESSADVEPPTQPVVPCKCQTAKVELTTTCMTTAKVMETTTCVTTARAVEPVTSVSTSATICTKEEKICTKEEKICTCKTGSAVSDESGSMVKPCCKHGEKYPSQKAKCNCHCQKAKSECRAQKAKSHCCGQKAKFYCRCPKVKSNCHCQKDQSNGECEKTKCHCSGQVKRKLKRDVGGDEVKGDFLVFKAVPGEWLEPSCLSSTFSSANTGNPFNSILMYLSWPDSQNKTKFSVEINGDGQSVATHLHVKLQYFLLLGGVNIMLTFFFH